jgi:small conductance mechanosensitive channel
MISVIKNILLRINHISFLFLLLNTLIWLAGYKDVYEKITVGVLLSCLIMAGAIILMVLWNSILLNFNRSFSKDSIRISEFSEFLARNIVIIRRAGLICIVGITAVAISQVWGIGAGGVLNFENNYLRISFRVISILIGAFVLIQLTKIVVERLKKEATIRMQSSNVSCTIEIEKRVATMSNIVQKMVMGGVVLFAVIMAMDELGFDIKAMLAGVGVIGLAVGFGAQNLVRDIISGLFLIFENRIRVGDVAIINGTGGAVVQVNLRTTVLRSVDGTVHVFPNGSINSLSNMTHEFSFYVFEISVCYNENVDRVIKALKEVGEEIISDPDFKDAILEPLEIQE